MINLIHIQADRVVVAQNGSVDYFKELNADQELFLVDIRTRGIRLGDNSIIYVHLDRIDRVKGYHDRTHLVDKDGFVVYDLVSDTADRVSICLALTDFSPTELHNPLDEIL